MFRLYRVGRLLRLESVFVTVTYDGDTIQVIPHPRVGAWHCGVCGNYDGDIR